MTELPSDLTERQQECIETYKACHGSERDTAKALGIDVKALRSSLWLATLKGWIPRPDKYSPVAPVGWECSYSTVQHDGDGNVVQQWDRVKPILPLEEYAKFLEQRVPVSKVKFPKVKNCNENLMLEWPVFDAHHGMLAWAKETGEDYDHKISRHLQISAGKILFQSFGKVKKSVIILGGDNQTADNRAGVTEQSGNHLDTDSRFQKMAWCSYEAAVTCIEIAARFSESVSVIVLSGNHDWHSAIHLTIQLHAHFRKSKKITIDTSPEEHRFYSWGKTAFMASHGDTPEKRLPAFALQRAIRKGYAKNPDMHLRVRLGHLHKRGKKTPDLLCEEDGVIIERFPTLAAQEAYSVKGAYTSCRATEANLFHAKHSGRFGLREVTVGEILEKYPI